jgi:hypothetical protein
VLSNSHPHQKCIKGLQFHVEIVIRLNFSHYCGVNVDFRTLSETLPMLVDDGMSVQEAFFDRPSPSGKKAVELLQELELA